MARGILSSPADADHP